MKNTGLLLALLTSLLFIVSNSLSQESNSINITPKLAINAFLEGYYGYDFGEPQNKNRPEVFVNHSQHNKINLNAGILGIDYRRSFIRGAVSGIIGTYAKQNLSEKQGVFSNIYEAKIGVRLMKKQDLWLDFGVMESNLGFESVRSNNNYTMTRSILSESSPYYINAIKLGFLTTNKKWKMEMLFSNGWNNIIDGFPSFGHTLIYKPNDHWKFNSSSMLGRVKIDGIVPVLDREEFRFFHNFYAKYKKEKIAWIAGVDFGIDQLTTDSDDIGSWLGLAGIFKYKLNENFSSSLRLEYFLDPNSSVVRIENMYGFESLGASLNIDYKLGFAFTFRVEGRLLSGKENYFNHDENPTNNNFYLGISGIFSMWKKP